jgi:phenylalanyl-tRNA synthetase beta chain
MKLPLSWLKDYVDFEDTIAGLSDKLTFSGIEVEAIEQIGFDPAAYSEDDIARIVVAEIREVNPHPGADRLTLCTIFDGSDSSVVVCGAPNVRVGMKTIFAPVGVTLANGLKLKKAKIRGVESLGMLCAEDELGISSDHDGIIDLSDDTAIGTPIHQVYTDVPEVVFELEITPNRPDCLSIIGVAREVAALYDSTLKLPGVDFPENGDAVESLTSVEILDATRCPRYTARVMTGITIAPSPEWMQRRLTLAGVRPINNAVDITNYVMLECGQPLHAFDYSLLKGRCIVVRNASAGETMNTLDGQSREFTADHLLIADAERSVAVAGVMGGADSEIRDNTETILLESAMFDASNVRATAKNLNLNTESSYRFARGCDIGGVDWTSRRATALLVEHAGATVAKGVIDVYPQPAEAGSLTCRYEKIFDLVGIQAGAEAVKRVFNALHLTVLSDDATSCTVRIPTFRRDLTREVDLIEEFSRIYGLDQIPTPAPRAEIVTGADDAAIRAERRLRHQLNGLGLQQIMNYSQTSPQLLDALDPERTPSRIVLPMPMSMDKSILRTSLLPQLVDTLGRNKAYQNHEAAVFELGSVFSLDGDQYNEGTHLSIGLLGPIGRGRLDKMKPVKEEEMYGWIKGVLEQIAVNQECTFTFEALDSFLYAPGRAAKVLKDGAVIGEVGLVKKELREKLRMSEPVAVAEIDIATFLHVSLAPNKMTPVPTYPSTSRDAALVVDESVKHADVMKVIKANAPKELEAVELFDVFHSDKLGAGKKSMAYSFTYRSSKGTLTDDQATGFHEKVKDRLRDQLKADVPKG